MISLDLDAYQVAAVLCMVMGEARDLIRKAEVVQEPEKEGILRLSKRYMEIAEKITEGLI